MRKFKYQSTFLVQLDWLAEGINQRSDPAAKAPAWESFLNLIGALFENLIQHPIDERGRVGAAVFFANLNGLVDG